MTCWNCRANVPMAPFCRNCGAALPDPETRRAAITTRLGEIENERRVLESQLARVNGSTPAGTQTVISSPTSTAGVGSPEPIQPAATATVTPTTPATPSRISQLSPSLLVTLIGVVVLGVASLVSAKEHEPLISLSHSTRISVLIVELIIATIATLLLTSRRAMLADAFGSLTWAAGLSLALLATVNVDTGLISNSWTYSIPFIVALPILALTRLKLPITRFVSFGTLGYGVWHLALFGLKDSAVEFLPMFRVALVMVLVSLVCAAILWVAHSARSDEWNEAEKVLAFIGIAFVYSTTLFSDLPAVHDISSSILATIGLLSMAVPFVTAAVALQRRGSSDALLGSQAYFVVAGLLTLNTVTALALGHSVEFISHDIFSGSRTATLWFPVILTIAAFGTAAIAMRTAWKVAGWILTAIALVPSVGAVAASLRWEFLGYLGSDRTTTAISENFYSFGSSIGWFGRGVTIAHVPSVVVALSGLSVATALLVAGRSMRTTRGSRAMRQAGFVALTATTLATVLRYTPALSAPHIVAVTLAVLAVGAFFASRLWNDEAPVDEWLP